MNEKIKTSLMDKLVDFLYNFSKIKWDTIYFGSLTMIILLSVLVFVWLFKNGY